MASLPRTRNLEKRVPILPQNRNLAIRIRETAETSALTNKPPIQPAERGKFVNYKASASDSHVNPINLKLLPAILKEMRILRTIWLW